MKIDIRNQIKKIILKFFINYFKYNTIIELSF